MHRDRIHFLLLCVVLLFMFFMINFDDGDKIISKLNNNQTNFLIKNNHVKRNVAITQDDEKPRKYAALIISSDIEDSDQPVIEDTNMKYGQLLDHILKKQGYLLKHEIFETSKDATENLSQKGYIEETFFMSQGSEGDVTHLMVILNCHGNDGNFCELSPEEWEKLFKYVAEEIQHLFLIVDSCESGVFRKPELNEFRNLFDVVIVTTCEASRSSSRFIEECGYRVADILSATHEKIGDDFNSKTELNSLDDVKNCKQSHDGDCCMNQAIFAKPKQESNEKVTFEDWNLNQQIHYWKGFNIWHACCFDPLDESLKDDYLNLAIQKSPYLDVKTVQNTCDQLSTYFKLQGEQKKKQDKIDNCFDLVVDLAILQGPNKPKLKINYQPQNSCLWGELTKKQCMIASIKKGNSYPYHRTISDENLPFGCIIENFSSDENKKVFFNSGGHASDDASAEPHDHIKKFCKDITEDWDLADYEFMSTDGEDRSLENVEFKPRAGRSRNRGRQ